MQAVMYFAEIPRILLPFFKEVITIKILDDNYLDGAKLCH